MHINTTHHTLILPAGGLGASAFSSNKKHSMVYFLRHNAKANVESSLVYIQK